MPLDLQASLLRVLEDKFIMRIGSGNIVPINVRVIAATNKNMGDAVKNGQFRSDLFYRLNVLPINMIPLRNRKDDIRLLTGYFYKKMLNSFHKQYFQIPDNYIEYLESYSFPGNIRELQNIIERSINFSKYGKLDIEYLPNEVHLANKSKCNKKNVNIIRNEKHNDTHSPTHKFQFNQAIFSIEEFEINKILNLIEVYNGNISKVASEMKIARSTLYRKINKYKVSKHFNVMNDSDKNAERRHA
jgi:transcriptional regulator with PAS, ATPase and Fis domain